MIEFTYKLTDDFLKRKLLISEAKRWIGIKESGGDNAGEVISIFQDSVGDADPWPWCLSFVHYCASQVDRVIQEVAPGSKENQLFKTEHCLTLWRRADKSVKSDVPINGSIALWQMYKDGEPTEAGHCGIVTRIGQGQFFTIEGNTTNPLAPTFGEGVYEKTRPLVLGEKMRLLGFVNPWPA